MDRLPMNVYCAMHARPTYMNAFDPLLDDFFVTQNRHNNAILVDVAPLAILDHFALETIANGLANPHFRGYLTDFLVARYSERDYVVFLLE